MTATPTKNPIAQWKAQTSPLIQSPPVSYTPTYVDNETPLSEIEKQDAEELLMMATGLYCAWNSVRTIKDVVSLATATMKHSQHRRAIFQHPYGFKNSEGRSQPVIPID